MVKIWNRPINIEVATKPVTPSRCLHVAVLDNQLNLQNSQVAELVDAGVRKTPRKMKREL